MGNLSLGVCMYHLTINSHNVQFIYQSHTAQLLSKRGMLCGAFQKVLTSLGAHGEGVTGQEVSTDFCVPRVWGPGKIQDAWFNLNFR